MNSDKAYENYLQIFNKFNGNIDFLNEANTRSRIIDAILIDCLGYNNDCIYRETPVGSGYIDYELKVNGNTHIVIEAKKAGSYFELPSDYNKRQYKINGSIASVKNLMDAVNQVHNYCVDIGCKFAAVFNGHQIVLFAAITLGKSWREGYCYVFRSLEDIKDNFSLFWNILAFENVRNGALISYLEKNRSELYFEKILFGLHNQDENLVRNDLYTYIQPISDLIFSELLDEKRTEVLKECYVYGRSNNPLTNDITNFFVDKLPNFLNKYRVKEIIENESDAGSFKKEFLQKAFLQKGNDTTEGALIVLLGGIGSGKSTFLHRFFKIVLGDHENLIWFYTDFRTSSIKESEIESFILQKMLEIWESKYEVILTQLLDKFGFSKDKSDLKLFFSKLFNLLHYCKFSIALIIDNVDQHEKNFQEKIFISASHLTDMLKTVTIISLREETFLISTKTGVFDAYHIPKFHIASPNFLSMIVRRVHYTIKLLKNKNIGFMRDIPEHDLEKLIQYFIIIFSSLTARNNQSKQLVHFIDSISVGNMREALRMFNNFLKSGNTNIKEIFDKLKLNKGTYQLSYHQFLKSIILGEYRYYCQERSSILNIFDFDTSLADSHFNLLRVLNYLFLRENKQSGIGRGYALITDLITAAEEVSITRDVIYDSLLRLIKYKLVECDNLSVTDLKNASFVKITPSGKYYLGYLGNIFIYSDLIYIDTPISDKNVIDKLKKFVQSTELSKRLYRMKIFLQYIVDSETKEFCVHPEYATSDFTNRLFGQEIMEEFLKLENEIRDRQQVPVFIDE
jgi:predicted type IV restriction endonuclease